jgi:hypothetical protein
MGGQYTGGDYGGGYNEAEAAKQRAYLEAMPAGEGNTMARSYLEEFERRKGRDTTGAPLWAQQRQQMLDQMQAREEYSQQARAQAADARSQFYQGLDPLRERAAGQNLVSDAVMRQQQNQLMANQQSMLASQRGGYNPGAFRQAQMQTAGQGQQMAGQLAAMKAQEQAQAQQALMAGLQQGRQGDLQQLQSEFAGEQGMNAFTQGMMGLGNQALGLGLQDKDAIAKNMLGQQQINAELQKAQMEAEAKKSKGIGDFFGGLFKGGLSMFGSALGGLGSSKSKGSLDGDGNPY